jgi:predicted nucleic acid-binding protein
VDASVGAKWLLAESDSNRAYRFLHDMTAAGSQLAAPPIFAPELTSAVYKQFTSGALTSSEASSRLQRVAELPVEPMMPADLPVRAFQIAEAHRWKWVCDAFYLALAEIVGCELWTADAQLHRDVRAAHPNVRLLSEYTVA